MVKSGINKMSLADWLFLTAILVLSLCGLLVFYSLSIEQGWLGLMSQLVVVMAGWALFFWMMNIDYRFWRGFGWIFYVLMLILLVVVLVLGTVKFGARRWIDLVFVSFQPSEIGKFFLLIFLAKFMAGQGETMTWKDLLISLLIVVAPFLLVLQQPDLGTALVFVVIWAAMVFVSPLPRRYIWMMLVIFVLALPLIWINMHEYQQNRILTFVDPSRDPYGAGYNVLQSQIAVGSGGVWGQGLGKGWQSQLHFLPVAYSDFAFAVFAEEFGFAGGVMMLILMMYVIWYVWRVGFEAGDQYGFYLAVGAGAMLFFQFVVNMAMNLGIMPVTGIPLPMVSSGGTSIITYFILLGVVYSVGVRSLRN